MKNLWLKGHGFPLSRGVVKEKNADFVVVERLPEQPVGEGEHLWITLLKDGQNTAWVARQLANWAGVKPRDVSYAGLKDRHAVTQQTFSVHLPGKSTPAIQTLQIEGVQIIDAQRHQRKLKTGQLIGNNFTVRVRHSVDSIEAIQERWQKITVEGVPNYFGLQRFGHDGKNVENGLSWLLGNISVPRHNQSIYISAVRAYLFNHLLEKRVIDGTWNQLIPSDFVQFTEGKSGFYCEEPDENDVLRCQKGLLSPCASLPGFQKESFPILDQREDESLSSYSEWLKALENKKVLRQFRKLRVIPEQTRFEVIDGDPVFHFFLPAGSFATTLISELYNWEEQHQESVLE